MKKVINGKMYDTDKAELIATDRYWDGSNWERNGRNTYLYKTVRGNYFVYRTSNWQDERDNIEALTIDEAKELYESLTEIEMDYKDAFGIQPEDA
jgi:hypothetical protein